MKCLVVIAAILSLSGSSIAADVTAEEAKLIGTAVRKLYKLETTTKRLESPAIAKLTDAMLYKVEVKIKGPDGTTLENMQMVRNGDEVSSIPSPSTNQDCPEIKALIKPDFRLKTDADAESVEALLDQLYPIEDRFNKKDKEAKAIRKGDNSFTFIRGKFFKDSKGYIFDTDADGVVQKVRFSLRIKDAK